MELSQALAALAAALAAQKDATDARLAALEARPTDTLDLAGSLYFEVEIIDASGNVSTPSTGTIQINPGLIRPE